MNAKKAMPLILAIVLGLVAMVMARRLLKPPAPTHAPTNTTPVVVATRDVPLGKELTAEDLAAADVPSSVVPAQAFTNATDLVGRVATSPLVKGQAVLETLLAPMGSGVGLGALIPDGMRAMTMNVDEITGLGGMIMPGCHVDVNVMVPDERTKQQMARTVLQDLKVVAVGRQFAATAGDAPPPTPTNNVTFLVTPDQARVLELAASTARPWLTLRGGRDKAPVKNDRTLLAQMHGDDTALPDTRPGPTTGPSDTVLVAANSRTVRSNVVYIEETRGTTVSRVPVPMPPGMHASGMLIRSEPEPANTAGGTEVPVPLANAATGRSGGDAAPTSRPSTVTDVDQSDAFNHDPFIGGSPR